MTELTPENLAFLVKIGQETQTQAAQAAKVTPTAAPAADTVKE